MLNTENLNKTLTLNESEKTQKEIRNKQNNRNSVVQSIKTTKSQSGNTLSKKKIVSKNEHYESNNHQNISNQNSINSNQDIQ